MGKIRDQMLAELELRGMSVRTQDTYLMCCRQFVGHFMKSPEQLGAAKRRHSSCTSSASARRARRRWASTWRRSGFCIGSFYGIRKRWRLPRPKVPIRLPVVPSRDEVRRLLRAVRSLKYRTILTVAYGAGLRVSEVCRLQAADIDSEQMVLHIRGAKGGKDRLVPLAPEC